MISGAGVDIVEIPRMKEAVEKWGRSFLEKVFTAREIAYSNSKRFAPQHFAARFAAKEAVIKAFGAPRAHPLRWTDIEVVNNEDGRPSIRFSGDALALKRRRKIADVIISMSHSHNYAVAQAILLKKER